MDYMQRYEEWLTRLTQGDPLRRELEQIRGDDEEIKSRFGTELSFGTAGLRGVIGAGTNRMNIYTVGRAAQGVAECIAQEGSRTMERGVVIAHDPRHMSPQFCRLCAEVFAANGIHVYVFPDIRPTPELAFMIRRLETAGGVNITASHNPPEYNGFKVYWSDGCQVGQEIADRMTQRIQAADYFNGVRRMDYDEAFESGLITVLGADADGEYLDKIESLAIHGGDEIDASIPIVYTPLNGAGARPFRRMMKDRGFDNWAMVPEQTEPDPDFRTVGYPNPEDPDAFKMARQLGREMGAELLMATDPDSDRFAAEIASPDEESGYRHLNGNQTGYLLVNYILGGRKDAGTLSENGAIVKSIVTSSLADEIAASYGVKTFDALTGFKNICGRIPDVTAQGFEYLFGYEESVGYAACPYIRDKDGISAGMLVAEAAAYYRKQGRTLAQVLDGIYEKFGYYVEEEPNIVLKGLEGAARISRMMSTVRRQPPAKLAGYHVEKVIDYLGGYEDIPASNVLKFVLEKKSGTWFAVRPSGTEPKIKFYFYTKQDSMEQARKINAAIREDFLRLINDIA